MNLTGAALVNLAMINLASLQIVSLSEWKEKQRRLFLSLAQMFTAEFWSLSHKVTEKRASSKSLENWWDPITCLILTKPFFRLYRTQRARARGGVWVKTPLMWHRKTPVLKRDIKTRPCSLVAYKHDHLQIGKMRTCDLCSSLWSGAPWPAHATTVCTPWGAPQVC